MEIAATFLHIVDYCFLLSPYFFFAQTIFSFLHFYLVVRRCGWHVVSRPPTVKLIEGYSRYVQAGSQLL